VLSTACALTLGLALSAASPQAPSPTEPARDRPLSDLLTILTRDIRALPSAESALLLGAGGGSALMLHPADDNLAGWAGQRGRSAYSRLGNVLGDGWIQGGAAAATYAIGLAGNSPAAAHVGSDLLRGQMLNGLATRGLKLAAGRRRPKGGADSLPSGHTSATFVTAAVLDSHFGWKIGLPAYAVAGFVGWSRLRDDAHWLTDVIVGGTIGAIVGRTVAHGHRERRWAVVPTASARSVGVTVARR
jgi:membrane-associated phospholipid phosphatase